MQRSSNQRALLLDEPGRRKGKVAVEKQVILRTNHLKTQIGTRSPVGPRGRWGPLLICRIVRDPERSLGKSKDEDQAYRDRKPCVLLRPERSRQLRHWVINSLVADCPSLASCTELAQFSEKHARAISNPSPLPSKVIMWKQ